MKNLVSDDDKIRVGCYECPICKSKDKYISDDVQLLPFLAHVDEESSEMKPAYFACFPCVCRDCGFIMPFAVPAKETEK